MKKLLLSLAVAALSLPAMAETVTDVLNQTNVGNSGTTYASYTYTGTSGAEYALQCAGDKGSIQLRSNNNNSGIVVTKSAGTIVKIEIDWNTETADARTLNIYQSATAYTNPTELYAAGLSTVATLTKSAGEVEHTFNPEPAYIGMRSASAAMYINEIRITWDTEGEADPGEDTPKPTTIYSGLSVGPTASEGWTISNVTLPEALTYVWSWDTAYGYKGSAYVNSTNYATDSYLISPVIDLDGYKDANLYFDQAVNFLKGNSNLLSVVVREGTDGAWQTLTVTGWPTSDSWNFSSSSASLAAYDGKSIQIGFRYTSTTEVGATWEIKNFAVTGIATDEEPGGEEPGGEEPGDDGEVKSHNFVWSQMGYENGAEIGTVTKDGITLTFEKGSNSNTTKYYTSGEAIRMYTGNTLTITVPQGNYISDIVFDIPSGYEFNAEAEASAGTLDLDTNTWTTTSEEINSVTITNGIGTSGQVRFASIYVYVNGDEPGETPDEPEGPEAPEGTITVSEAIALIAEGYKGEATVEGIISQIDSFNETYGSITYWISDDGTTASQLQVYGGLGLDGDKFDGIEDIMVGATVTVKGNLKSYNGTPEFDLNSVILDYKAPTSDGIGAIEAAEGEAVYYNLQGVRVVNPDRGIFVKVLNGKAVKVVK